MHEALSRRSVLRNWGASAGELPVNEVGQNSGNATIAKEC